MTVRIVQTTNKQDFMREDLGMTKRGKYEGKIESLLITAPNDEISTNYIKAKIHNTQKNFISSVWED